MAFSLGAALFAVALGCTDVTSTRTSSKPSSPEAKASSPSPGPDRTSPASPTPGTPTPDTGPDLNAGIDRNATSAPVETLAPVYQPEATPTPLGAAERPIDVAPDPRFLAFLQNTVHPYVLRAADLIELDNNYGIGNTYTQGVGQPQGIAADGAQDLWVLSAQPPHVDRWELGLGVIGLASTFPVPASPSAIAARDGEAWVGANDGTLTRIVKSSGATESFPDFGSPRAIAIGQDHVWVANAAGTLFKVERSGGSKVATLVVGPGPSGVAIDPAGNVWVSLGAGPDSVRVAATDGSTSSVALGAAAPAVVADQRRIWFAGPGKLSYWQPDGQKEGEVELKVPDVIMGERTLQPDALAIDANGRVWVLDRQGGEALRIWGRKPSE